MKNFLFVGFAFAFIFSASANTIGHWTFETSKPTTAGPVASEIGTGTASGVHASSSTAYSNPTGNASSESWSANRWAAGDYWEFQVSTLGSENIQVSYDQYGSGTGPRDFDFAYSTDGSIFTVFQSYQLSGADTWNSKSFDLSATPLLDEASMVYFRLINSSAVSINGGAIGTSGSDRIDNFLITGAAVAHTPDTLPFGFAAMTLTGFVVSSRKFLTRIPNP
ncbi:MAG TPA: hypothetical protein VFW05_17110 [Verrucomicrobiae bacterium]|nr:hypothetical protein [Verrucomicrobiae bacterium]